MWFLASLGNVLEHHMQVLLGRLSITVFAKRTTSFATQSDVQQMQPAQVLLPPLKVLLVVLSLLEDECQGQQLISACPRRRCTLLL